MNFDQETPRLPNFFPTSDALLRVIRSTHPAVVTVIGPCQLKILGVLSGKQPHNYGKSPLVMGKLTMSMVIFNSYVIKYQRVIHVCAPKITVTVAQCDDFGSFGCHGIRPCGRQSGACFWKAV